MRGSWLYLLCALATSQALAADPPSAPAAPAQTQSPPATKPEPDTSASAATSAPPAAAAAVKTDAGGPVSADELKRLRAEGYRQEMTPAGDTVYCRKEAQVGTRIETKMCATWLQIQQMHSEASEWTQRLQKNATPQKGAP
jgi:hypothetical protein